MTSASSSTVTSRPPGPPSAPLTEREIKLLRLLSRGQSLQRIIIDWDGPHEPTRLEIGCLQNLYAERISLLRRVWAKQTKGTPS